MASPLDFWSLIPYFALVWIAACMIHIAKFAYAEINGRLPHARSCSSQGSA